MKILVVDDEKNIRQSVIKYLELEGWEAEGAQNGLEAKEMLQQAPWAAIILDLRMPKMDGQELLVWLKSQEISVPVIMMSAHGDISDAVEAMKAGAADYLIKPFDPEELVLRLKQAVEAFNLRRKYAASAFAKEGFVGESPQISKIREFIQRVAPTDSTILILGESGTGKEVAAEAVHKNSKRKTGPFIAVNVASIPDGLLESELFGHEKGAFTGANRRKPGLFESANGGTLFLDEIGEMAQALQAKLLRVLQERRVRRVGGEQLVPVDVRIVAATNKDLQEQVTIGNFREDLYFRLNVVSFTIPPLRERREDIPLLAQYFVERFRHQMGRPLKGVSENALATLRGHNFPGNVRELENLIERGCIFAETETIEIRDMGLEPVKSSQQETTKPYEGPAQQKTLQEIERAAIEAALKRHNGNRTRTANELGITRRTIITKIKDYGL